MLVSPATAAPPSTARACVACRAGKPADAFEMIRDARGKHARRRVCITCITAVDKAVSAGEPAEQITRRLRVSAETVRERKIVRDATAPAPPRTNASMRTCGTCRKARRPDQFDVNEDTGAARKVCRSCLSTIDSMLTAGNSVTKAVAVTGASPTTVTERRRQLGLPSRYQRMSPQVRAAILALAATTDPDQIAAEVGEDPAKVRRLLLREGLVEAAPTGPIPPELLAQARLLIEDEAPYAEVARTTGISMNALARHFPGKGATRDHKSLVSWIHMDPTRQALHREITRGLPQPT